MRFSDLPHLSNNTCVRRMMLFVLISLLTLWHGHFFLAGYRLTADDVYFTYIALQGSKTVLDTARWIAEGQGRIGFIFLQPVNMFSALMSEFLAWRILFVSLYMLTVWLAFVYAARVLKLAIAPLAFLIFLALHPLGFDHLPPTSYPLQNTLPFLVLITCRLIALTRGERGAWMVLGRVLQISAMMATEFALLLGVVMIAAETLSRHSLRIRHPLGWLRAALGDTRAWGDMATLALVVGPYIVYRLAHPSGYDGNSLDGFGNIGALIKTTWRHITDGLVLPRLQTRFLQAPPLIWAGAVLAGIGMYAAMRLALRHIGGDTKPLGAVAAFLMGAMIFITLPISATVKQQAWCNGSGSCAYLDSRTTILGVVLLLAVSVTTLLHRWQGRGFDQRLHRWVAGLTAVIFAMAALHNWYVAQKMARYDEVWNSARTMACVPDLAPTAPERLYDVIDPNRVIPFHEADAPLRFWPLYLETVRRQSDCSETEVLRRSLTKSYLPSLWLNKLQPIGGDEGGKYLGTGWSNIEKWGVWSSKTEVQLFLNPQGLTLGERAFLQLDAHMFLDSSITSQRLIVTQQGQTLWKGTRRQEEQDTSVIVPLLPYDPAQEIITLTLTLPDAQAPSTNDDMRALGIGLKGLMLRRP